jgi:hypothetical protein
MLERDDEDLAIDQLPARGGADDPQLRAPPGIEPEPLQEHGANTADPPLPTWTASSLAALRDRLEQLRAQLAALPTRDLDRLDELDATARELSGRRDSVRDTLDRLPPPHVRRFGRSRDPHIIQRKQLASALNGLETQLERALTDRAKLADEFGDPDAIHAERDGLSHAIQILQRERRQALEHRIDHELATEPSWVRHTLGERPDRRSDGRRWDRAAHALVRYRVEYDITDGPDEALGAPPVGDRDQRRAYERAIRERDQFHLELGFEPPGNEVDLS